MGVRPLVVLAFASAGIAGACRSDDGRVLVRVRAMDSAEAVVGVYMASHARDPEVLRYAGMLARDHGADMREIDALVRMASISLPRLSGDTTPSATARFVARLDSLAGRDRDTTFVSWSIVVHQARIAETKQLREAVHNPDVRSLLTRLLTQLDTHFTAAFVLIGKLGP